MRIEIDINDPYIDVIRKWASVSRTLNQAKKACRVAADHSDETDAEKFIWCLNELRQIEPAIDALHQTAQSAIWEQDVLNKTVFRNTN